MDIRSGFDGLRSLLGVSQAAQPAQSSRSGAAQEHNPLSADSATLSSAANQVAQCAGDGDVRMDKVASVQDALAAGTYHVQASAVASRLVDAMLGTAH